MTTRSLSVANTGNGSSVSIDTGDLALLSLLYYENPTGNVSALCQLNNDSIIDEWIDISSQESRSLPDVFHNGLTSATDGNSKTLYESLISKLFTLSAPFTCQTANAQQSGIDAFFYSPNASNVAFESSNYLTGPNGPGNFSLSMHSYSCAP